jgi:hypothetical protein
MMSRVFVAPADITDTQPAIDTKDARATIVVVVIGAMMMAA